MSIVFRRYVPLVLTVVTGLVVLINFFTGQLLSIANAFKDWATWISWVAFYFSTVYLLIRLSTDVLNRRPQWYISLFGISVWVLRVLLGLFSALDLKTLRFDITKPVYNWFTQNVSTPAGQGYSVTYLFAVALGVYRTFKVRNLEAAALMVAFLFAVFENAPIFGFFWGGLDIMAVWLSSNITKSAARGLLLAGAFGAVGLMFRTILGLERGLREVT